MTVIHRPWLYKDDEDDIASPPPRWPGPRPKQALAPHDDATRRLMQTYDEMYRLEQSEVVVPLLEEWKPLDRMGSVADKQRFLEPLIQRVKRAPEKNAGRMIFLLLVCEPIRASVATRLLSVRSSLEEPTAEPSAYRREEAKRVNEIDRGRVHDLARDAVMHALYRYPSPSPDHFFGWLKETVAYRALDFLRDELAERDTTYRRDEAEALQEFLAGFDDVAPPALGQEGGFRRWRIQVWSLYEPARLYMQFREVKSLCRIAVDRLPRKQQAIIEAEFYEGKRAGEIAQERGIARSTVYNHKAQALRNLHDDDCFFMALCGMEIVRDAVRRDRILEKCPDGRLPDGRRIVFIQNAA